MSARTKVLDIRLDGFHIECVRINDRKEPFPFRVFRITSGQRRQIAKCADFMTVINFIRSVYIEGADTYPVNELIQFSQSIGALPIWSRS